MAASRISVSVFLFVALMETLLFPPASAATESALVGWVPGRLLCNGKIAECLGGEEFDLASELDRRILASSEFLSYAALKRGSVPCSRRGASYYNCHSGAPANPYSRGCSRITRCRS
ncbi:hypothetical protein HPP92_010403 [Vanilla planifolia]|uniref:Uncharacterized protein n=1 Tax=Vanilla planifolia TaxID=51239 RepID=A0A835R4L5_VANPL|nr:hypothetical protein HPP92_010696 [Vanilla planifolia]KAG0482319.1 hypothetical protein HPP92_010403 [Vanilla planifolia]